MRTRRIRFTDWSTYKRTTLDACQALPVIRALFWHLEHLTTPPSPIPPMPARPTEEEERRLSHACQRIDEGIRLQIGLYYVDRADVTRPSSKASA